MKNILQKLKSRKLWACLVGVVIGVAAMFGVEESTVGTVSGAVMSVLSVVTYIIAEGKIDAAAVSLAVNRAEEAVKAVEKEPDKTAREDSGQVAQEED